MKQYWLYTTLMATVMSHAAQAYEPYAEDILRAQAIPTVTRTCPPLNLTQKEGQAVLNETDAKALLCHVVQDVPLAESVMEFGCTDRSELIIGTLLHKGVPFDALGRASTFFDAQRNVAPPPHGGQGVFAIEDKAHGHDFQRAWHLVFGTQFAPRIVLQTREKEFPLDVSGKIRWNIGHIAPTVWVETEDGKALRVIDPLLSRDALLTVEEWRSLQQAEPAAVLWGGLGKKPDILTEYLPPDMKKRLILALHIPTHDVPSSERINTQLANTPFDMKVDVYEKVLDIEHRAAWHPRNWQGYSFAGDELPDWQPNNPRLIELRYMAAKERLAVYQAYHDMRQQFADDEAFLNAVKDRMLKANKNPKRVFIDLKTYE